MQAIYKIVFTAFLLYEIFKYRIKNVEVSGTSRRGNRGGSGS